MIATCSQNGVAIDDSWLCVPGFRRESVCYCEADGPNVGTLGRLVKQESGGAELGYQWYEQSATKGFNQIFLQDRVNKQYVTRKA